MVESYINLCRQFLKLAEEVATLRHLTDSTISLIPIHCNTGVSQTSLPVS